MPWWQRPTLWHCFFIGKSPPPFVPWWKLRHQMNVCSYQRLDQNAQFFLFLQTSFPFSQFNARERLLLWNKLLQIVEEEMNCKECSSLDDLRSTQKSFSSAAYQFAFSTCNQRSFSPSAKLRDVKTLKKTQFKFSSLRRTLRRIQVQLVGPKKWS